MNPGRAIAETLKLYDTEYFFAFSGGDQDLWIGLRDAGIKIILPRSERSAGAMADAYARLTGKPSFTYGQWGPGAALCVSAVAEAFWAKSPLICITSSMNPRSIYRYSYQGIDNQATMFEPITKWNVVVPEANRLPDILRTAIRTAASGVPGPVHIGIPNNLLMFSGDNISEDLYAEPQGIRVPAFRVVPEPTEIEKVIEAIAFAKKPLILSGGGVIYSEAWDELIRFAELLNIPVLTSYGGKGAINTNHPLYVGVPGNYSRKVANEVLGECDTLLVLGSNLGDMTTVFWRLPYSETRIIHIDIDPGVLGANFKEEISIVADAKMALNSMIRIVEDLGLAGKTPAWPSWTEEVQQNVKSWQKEFDMKANQKGAGGTINPYQIIALLNKFLQEDDLVVTDTGYMGAYGAALVDIKAPGKKIIRAAGSLGWGFPASLGAKLAQKDKGRVFCITGDGGLGYHISELETAMRLNLPVIVLCLNNASLAFEHHIQRIICKDIVPEVNDYLQTDFGAVAKSFGAHGEQVTRTEDISGALKRAVNAGLPAVLDFKVDKEIYAPVVYYEMFEGRQV